ncbi:hypothetical protein ALC57_15511 [Trachymyrmex cornetzi]|uniref:Uncharacterized protein n=1 Tax=Trachymyrmex cornetzi TaxID=471704 RepID=A0A151IWW6_9HYME|nr:hypothetical protein ALC57_15511 [Trachymyrmex cornetzi]
MENKNKIQYLIVDTSAFIKNAALQLNARKAPKYDLITGKIMKELPFETRQVCASAFLDIAQLRRDLKISRVKEKIRKYAVKHVERLKHHRNEEVLQLFDSGRAVRRLKKTKSLDLSFDAITLI